MDYTVYGHNELVHEATTLRETIERVLAMLARKEDTQEVRIQLYEALGCTRGDAQGIVEAEDLTN